MLTDPLVNKALLIIKMENYYEQSLFSDFIFILIYYVVGYRKKVVFDNLKLCFPNKSEKELKRISKKFYHHFCDMMLESMKSLTISEAEMKKRFTFTNIDEIKQHENNNRSVVLMCGHYANFEWSFILQRHLKSKGYAVYKQLANKHFDALIKRLRAKYNSYLITTKETIPTLIKAKREGELTINGFAADQSPKLIKRFIGIPFFNFPDNPFIYYFINLLCI